MNATFAVVKTRPEKKNQASKGFEPSALQTQLASQQGAGHYVGS